MAAVYAEEAGDTATVRALVEGLAAEPIDAVATEVARLLEQPLALSWEKGWQPADLDRAVRRQLGTTEAVVSSKVVASQAAIYAVSGRRFAPAWMAQLDDIGANPDRPPDPAYLSRLAAPWPEVLLAAVRLMSLLLRLPRIPRLVDPPSEWGARPSLRSDPMPGGVLGKIRALLAKAESTTFDAEADALTAKAQELMARHRIDRALLDTDGAGARESPVGRRLGVDDPYADAKATLLHGIARANGCRAVWSRDLGFATVFGFDGELDCVEELYTSLLVQATAALRREGSKRDGYGRSRTTRFRRSFLVAFAVRIGQRLEKTVEATVSAVSAERSTALVPILTARAEASSAAADAAFPRVTSHSPTAGDDEGWFAGALFADQADLGMGPEITRQSA